MYRKNLLFYILFAVLLTSCQKFDFDLISDDNLIYPGVDLQISTWEELDFITPHPLTDISFIDENTGIASGQVGRGTVYITDDGGKTWRTVETQKHMNFHCVYALDETTFFAGRRGLFKSTDRGLTWKTYGMQSVGDIWFKDSMNGFRTSSGSGMYRTVNAGESWSKVSDIGGRNLQFTSEKIGYYSYGSIATICWPTSTDLLPPSYGDICRTTNGGRTWHKMGLDVRLISCMSFISDRTGFFATHDGALYKTTDGGESCELIDIKDYHIYDIFFINEDQGFVFTGEGISITLDGGYTFHKEYSIPGGGYIYQCEFPSATLGYALGNNGLIIKRIQ